MAAPANFNDLFADLQQAVGGGTFTLSGQGLGSPSITALLTTFLGADSLVLTSAQAPTQAQAGTAVVVGTLSQTLLGVDNPTVTAAFTMPGSTVEVRLTVDAPSTWTPGAFFPSGSATPLDQFGWASCVLTLDSSNATPLPQGFPSQFGETSYPADFQLSTGLSLTASVSVKDAPGIGYGAIGWLFGSGAVTVSGPVALAVNGQGAPLASAVPSLYLASTPTPLALGPFTAPVGLVLGVCAADTSASPPATYIPVVQVVADIPTPTASAPNGVITITAAVDNGTSGPLFISGTATPPVTLSELATDLGSVLGCDTVDISALSQLPGGSSFGLSGLNLTLNGDLSHPSSITVAQVVLTVAITPSGGGWSLVTDPTNASESLVTLDGIEVDLSFTPSAGTASIGFVAVATATIGSGTSALTLDAEFSLPDYSFYLSLSPDAPPPGPVNVGSLLTSVSNNGAPSFVTANQGNHIELFGSFLDEQVRFRAQLDDTWSVSDAGLTLTLETASFDISYTSGATPPLSGQFMATAALNNIGFAVTASYDQSGWTFTGGCSTPFTLDLGTLASDLLPAMGITSVSIDSSALPSLTIEDLAFVYQPTGGGFSFNVTCGGFSIAQQPVGSGNLTFGLQVSRNGSSDDFSLAAYLWIGQDTFQLDLSKGSSTFIAADWVSNDGSSQLDLYNTLTALGLSIDGLPDALDLTVTGASIGYSVTDGALAIAAQSGSGGSILLVYQNNGTHTAYGLALAIGPSISLTDLPIVGSELAGAVGDLALQDMVIAATSAPLATAAAALNQVVTDTGIDSFGLTFPSLPTGSQSQALFSATLACGSNSKALQFALDGKSTTGATAAAPPGATGSGSATGSTASDSTAGAAGSDTASGAAGSGSSGSDVTWVNIQRAFGPLQINRVGLSYSSGSGVDVGLLLDASMSLSGLTLGLEGLEAAFPIQNPTDPTISLSGLEVGFSGGGLSISGGLQTVPGASPATYTGNLAITFGSFSATALGSYTDGSPASLSAFLFIGEPLGGPPFFFVTGLAGGFGYNTSLTLPAITGVGSFPLVQGALGQIDSQTVQTNLQQDIQASPGEDWLAVGVRFTSFEVLDSFALLTVAFGTQVDIALLGESNLTVPTTPPGGTAESVVAQAQMVLEVNVQPDSGQLAVCAQLTSASYVFDPAAQLTGGFAYYQWFGDNANAGDFVVTLGGYNPNWTPPSYYPTVPQLGLNWQVSSELAITGSLYFALTPSVIMAGGSLSATWQSGGINAWFDADADFLIRFKPFQYNIDVSVSIGASFTVSLLVTSVTVTIHAGVDLEIWGPEFGGTATVDLSVISFTISFGADQPSTTPPISWQEFRGSFLPPANATERSGTASAQAGTVTQTDSLITTTASAGLIGQLADGSLQVDPDTLSLVVATQIPSTAASLVTNATTPVNGVPSTLLGVGPMGVTPGNLSSALTITVTRQDETTGAWDADTQSWTATAVTGNVPAGLWANTDASLGNPSLVTDVLTSVTLVPTPPTPDQTLPVPLETLLLDNPPVVAFQWSPVTPPSNDNFDQSTAWQQLAATLVAPTGAVPQSALLAALQAQGLTTASSVDVRSFAADVKNLLTAPPLLRLLGERQ